MSQLVLSTKESNDERFIISSKKNDNILKLYNYVELAQLVLSSSSSFFDLANGLGVLLVTMMMMVMAITITMMVMMMVVVVLVLVVVIKKMLVMISK